MITHWLRPSAYSAFALFLLAGAFGAVFAWTSANLIHFAMENIRFLEMYGQVAIMDGGLVQLLQILAYGYLSLAFYMAFKVCEVELVNRWRNGRTEKPAP